MVTLLSEQFVEILPTGDIFHYSRNRPFGPYNEIVELARIAWCNRTQGSLGYGFERKMGEPVTVGSSLSFGNHQITSAHPIDYLWILFGENPQMADRIAQYYIRWRIEERAQVAERCLDKMLDHMNRPWAKWEDSLSSAFLRHPPKVVTPEQMKAVTHG